MTELTLSEERGICLMYLFSKPIQNKHGSISGFRQAMIDYRRDIKSKKDMIK